MRRILQFLRRGLWELDLRQFHWPRRIGLGALRVVIYTGLNYRNHAVGMRAGGMTLVTLLSIVPLLSIFFALSDSFGYRGSLESQLDVLLDKLPRNWASVVGEVRPVVERTSFKTLGIVGSMFLVLTGSALFTKLEQSLNFAWRAKASRSMLRRLPIFVTMLFLAPALGIGAMVLNSAVSSGSLVQEMRQESPMLMSLYDAGLWLLPYVMAALALSLLYMFVPNTRVKWQAALIAGVPAGIALLGVHDLYITFQVGVAKANAIYATLAAIPLLLLNLQVLWIVVLLGAEIGYAIQNVNRIGPEHGLTGLGWALRERLAVGLTKHVVEHYREGEGPVDLARCAARYDVSHEWLESVAGDLKTAKLMVATDEERLLPLKPGDKISLADVQRAVRGRITASERSRIALPTGLEQGLDDSRPALEANEVHFDRELS